MSNILGVNTNDQSMLVDLEVDTNKGVGQLGCTEPDSKDKGVREAPFQKGDDVVYIDHLGKLYKAKFLILNRGKYAYIKCRNKVLKLDISKVCKADDKRAIKKLDRDFLLSRVTSKPTHSYRSGSQDDLYVVSDNEDCLSLEGVRYTYEMTMSNQLLRNGIRVCRHLSNILIRLRKNAFIKPFILVLNFLRITDHANKEVSLEEMDKVNELVGIFQKVYDEKASLGIKISGCVKAVVDDMFFGFDNFVKVARVSGIVGLELVKKDIAILLITSTLKWLFDPQVGQKSFEDFLSESIESSKRIADSSNGNLKKITKLFKKFCSNKLFQNFLQHSSHPLLRECGKALEAESKVIDDRASISLMANHFSLHSELSMLRGIPGYVNDYQNQNYYRNKAMYHKIIIVGMLENLRKGKEVTQTQAVDENCFRSPINRRGVSIETSSGQRISRSGRTLERSRSL